MIRIDGIRLEITHSEADLENKAVKMLFPKKFIKDNTMPRYSFKVIRRSLDARKKPELFYVYSIAVELNNRVEEAILRNVRDNRITRYEPVRYLLPAGHGDKELTGRPVIVGAGPAGLFCAYVLSLSGFKPVIMERGEDVDKRTDTVRRFFETGKLDTDSNVQFGEGGAGTFSDGKLNTGVNDRNGRNAFVLETFVKFGANENITYVSKPHIGTDILIKVIKNMRDYINGKGGTFLFSTKFTGFSKDDEGIKRIQAEKLKDKRDEIFFDTNCLVLATGHSARDTFEMLLSGGITMKAKAFAVGLRIMHPQPVINLSRYGKEEVTGLGAADYKLVNHTAKGRDVYSFCMCPGGYVVNASSEERRLCVNGMSYAKRDSGSANSAIIVSVNEKDFGSEAPLAGMEFQRRLEEKAFSLGKGRIPVQRYGAYRENKESTDRNKEKLMIKGMYEHANLRELFSEEINEAIIESIDKFGYTIQGFDDDLTVLAGVESRTSSPVRIMRNDDLVSSISGIYPCGEGAGYAGGIVSAAIDGIRTAEAIIRKYSP